jgi:SAM-dependent methyltransferase
VSPAGPAPGHEVYSERVLRIYDPLVLWLTNSAVWRCPRRSMRALYDRNVGVRHLELGAGTGYFLHHCRFPAAEPRLHLVDLNPATLHYSARRLARYRPTVLRADVLKELPVEPGGFDSAALNMLLHCLPGEGLRAKAGVLARAAAAVRPGGRVFGSTVLARGVPLNRAARAMLENHNRRRILHNTEDGLSDLREIVAGCLTDVSVHTRGCMGLFEGTVPGPAPSPPGR